MQFNFGQSFTTTPSSFSSAIPTFSSVPTLTLPTTTTCSSNTIKHGLGGPVTQSQSDVSDNKSSKESSTLPPELLPLIDSLKKFIKEQKMIREENSQQRFSIQPILEVASELEENLKVNLHKIDLDLQRHGKSIRSVKDETNKLLSDAEMAFRISRIDIPSTGTSYSLAQNQHISSYMHQYFVNTIDNFETHMNKYDRQIKDLQLHLDNMNKPFGKDELIQIMTKQHEILISLASQVYAVHEQINKIKQSQSQDVNK